MDIFDEILGNIHDVPLLDDAVNQLAINHVATRTKARPRPFSLWSNTAKPADPDKQGPVSDYTSWPCLTDRRYSGRHLPPADPAFSRGHPPLDEVAALFKRTDVMKTDRSSVLFMFFAQWFTDSILRVDPTDRRKNTSNHEIDLCQIYGLTEEAARILRSNQGGKLSCQTINGESYLDYLFEPDVAGALQVKPQFQKLHSDELLNIVFDGLTPERKAKAYATGLERGNSTIGYVVISTLFMREHNRICDQLAANNPEWDDERLFQTARMINTVLLMKIVVEEYINHIAGSKIFKLDPTFAEKQDWYRMNWIAIEFDLLYRWHSLVPDSIRVNGTEVSAKDFRNNNTLVEEVGLAAILTSASKQKAGRIGLLNSPAFLDKAEINALNMSRDFRLCSYNDYREQFGLDRLKDFDDLTKDKTVQLKLRQLYKTMDNVEYLVGIFAEDRSRGSLFGNLLNLMVAYDAFTQIFTNPLLSQKIYNKRTFSSYGLSLIENTKSIHDIAARNINGEVLASLGA